MNGIDVSAEWRRLCEEHEFAKNSYFQAFSVVSQKFEAIGCGTSRTNPSEGELSEFETTWNNWENVKQRMDNFVKKYA